MYASPAEMVKLRRQNPSRPVILCEYVHAMGNSCGGVADYWDTIYAYPRMQGAFVWDWVDQGLRKRNDKGESFFAYGGDFGDFPNDGSFCLDGLVNPDRIKHPQLDEIRKVYQPVRFRAVNLAEGKIAVTNLLAFTNLDEYDCFWTVKSNGGIVAAGKLAAVRAAPYETREIVVPVRDLSLSPTQEYFLVVSFNLKTSVPWAEAGYAVAFEQFPLNRRPAKQWTEPEKTVQLIVKETGDEILFQGAGFEYRISKKEGTFSSLSVQSRELLYKPGKINFFRPPTENDRVDVNGMKKWKKYGLDSLQPVLKKIQYEIVNPQVATVTSVFDVVNQRKEVCFEVMALYTLYASGEIRIETWIEPDARIRTLPKVGWQFYVKKELQNVRWNGFGAETYPDRKAAGIVDVFQATVDELWHSHIVPQENGNRSDIRWVTLSDNEGYGLYADGDTLMNFSVRRYSDDNIYHARHTIDLQPLDYIVFNFDYRQQGIGTATCGPGVFEPYLLHASPMQFAIRLVPAHLGIREASDIFRSAMKPLPFRPRLKKPVVTLSEPFFNKPARVKVSSTGEGETIRYTLDGTEPDEKSPLYKEPFLINQTCTVTVKPFKKGYSNELAVVRKKFELMPYSSLSLKYPAENNLPVYVLFDRQYADLGDLASGWLCFRGTDMDLLVEMTRPLPVRLIQVRFMNDWWHRVYLPGKVVFEVSADGQNFKKVFEEEYDINGKPWTIEVKQYKAEIREDNVRYVRIFAENMKTYPSWHEKAGQPSPMMTDEIELE